MYANQILPEVITAWKARGRQIVQLYNHRRTTLCFRCVRFVDRDRKKSVTVMNKALNNTHLTHLDLTISVNFNEKLIDSCMVFYSPFYAF